MKPVSFISEGGCWILSEITNQGHGPPEVGKKIQTGIVQEGKPNEIYEIDLEIIAIRDKCAIGIFSCDNIHTLNQIKDSKIIGWVVHYQFHIPVSCWAEQ